MNEELIKNIADKTRKLQELKTLLKDKFFGIDNEIDKIVDSMRTWFVMPDIITSPIIINLWSLTGNGKTDLVRTIVEFLQFNNRFCEIQLSDTAESNGVDKISKFILTSGCKENEPGIILLDEFQRYRTINPTGQDIPKLPFQDIWLLLSDGKFPIDDKKQKEWASIKKVLGFEWREVQYDYNGNVTANEAVDESDVDVFNIREHRYTARKQKSAKLSYVYLPRTTDRFFGVYEDTLIERITTLLDYSVTNKMVSDWSYFEALQKIDEYMTNRAAVYDYSKCLIFVAGNLDEAFQVAGDVDNCDTNADIFHEYTKKVSIIEIKKALTTRFKPEQISRLGNNHIIYPSLNKDAYKKIIERACNTYLTNASRVSGVKFTLHESVLEEIYANAVYPTQGTRPVFSSIHMMFGAPLSNGVLWAMENGYTEITIKIFFHSSCITFIHEPTDKEICVPIQFQIRDRKNRHSINFMSLVSVHEMGHAILHSELFQSSPEEIKINVATFDGGYNKYRYTYSSAKDILDRICVGFGGIVAEEEIFGEQHRSTGSESDISMVTALAAAYIRKWSMHNQLGRIDYFPNTPYASIVDIKNTDSEVSEILIVQKERARVLMSKHRSFLIKSSKDLLIRKEFTGQEFEEYAKKEFNFVEKLHDNKTDTHSPYYNLLKEAK